MPAAAVIPAPAAYIKFAAVKKLVVGCLVGAGGPPRGEYCPFPCAVPLFGVLVGGAGGREFDPGQSSGWSCGALN